MKIVEHIKKAFLLSRETGQSMRRRFLMYTIGLILLLGTVGVSCLITLGHFSTAGKQTNEMLSMQLAVYKKEVAEHYDHLAALGILLSQNMTDKIEETLAAEGVTFSQLNNSDDIIKIENTLYDTLYEHMRLAECSGAYLVLNATVNTKTADSKYSNCGLYLKIANVNMEAPVNPKVVLYRGSTDVGKYHHIDYHNKWALEFDRRDFPDFDLVMENAEKNLNSCYLFTDVVDLPGTWEKAMLLCVPVIGSDGTVYGICGYEISSMYYKILLAQPSLTPHLTGLLCQKNSDELMTENRMESGNQNGYFADFNGVLSMNKADYFNIYHMGSENYTGLESPIRLSPLNGEWTVSVMIPKTDFDHINNDNLLKNYLVLLFLFLFAILGCFWMSQHYVNPILKGLETVKAKKAEYGKTNILEIDDLLEFLSAQDNKYAKELAEQEEAALKFASQAETFRLQAEALSTAEEKNSSYSQVPDLSAYQEFVKNIDTLSLAEWSVFGLYMKGYTAKEIADNLCLSMNTIKTHNRHIYMKLNVSSRKELMVYVQMMVKDKFKYKQDS